MRITESAADRMLQRIRIASGIETDLHYEFAALESSRMKAGLELRKCQLRLRRADAGAIRIELSLRGKFGLGFPYPDRQVDVSCAVLVRPELRRVEEGQIFFSADFARATVCDLRVSQRASAGLLAFDPYDLDPFAQDRMVEMARIALRAALRRMGLRQGRMTSPNVARLLEAAAEAGPLAFAVFDGEMEVGPEDGGIALPQRPSGWIELASHLTTEEAPMSDADARLRLGDRVLTRLSADLLAKRTWGARWRIEAPRVRCGTREIELHAELLPDEPRWPQSWRARVNARLRPQVAASGIEFLLLDFRLEQPALPHWTRRLLLRALAPRLARYCVQRSFSLPLPRSEDEHWKVEIRGIDLEAGRLDLLVGTDL